MGNAAWHDDVEGISRADLLTGDDERDVHDLLDQACREQADQHHQGEGEQKEQRDVAAAVIIHWDFCGVGTS